MKNMQIKYYYLFLVILGAISGILAFHGIYYDTFNFLTLGYGRVRVILGLASSGILSLMLSAILYYKFPQEKNISTRLRFLISFLIGFFIFWQGSFITNALPFKPSLIQLPQYLLLTLAFALFLSTQTYFIGLLVALVASTIITRGMENTRRRFFIILGLVILILWSNGIVIGG